MEHFVGNSFELFCNTCPLGHKRIKNTLKYVQLAEELFKGQIEYVSKVAKTEGEACALIDAGFDFVCDFNGNKLFRKRKR